VDQDPKSSNRSKLSYKTLIYVGLGLLALVLITWFCYRNIASKNNVLIADNTTDADQALALIDSAGEGSTPDSKGRSFRGDPSKLSKELRKDIFDLHILNSETRKGLTYEKGTEEVDVRLEEPWVESMKKRMGRHSNKVLRHLFTEFEKLTTVQIAVYLAQLSRYIGMKGEGAPKEAGETIHASIRFSRVMFNLIIKDKNMRKYLVYRGLRSQMDTGNWGTIIYWFARGQDDPKGSGWRWIGDEDGWCYRIKALDKGGETGTYYSVYKSHRLTKDTNGTGANDFKSKTVNVEPWKRIFEAGRL